MALLGCSDGVQKGKARDSLVVRGKQEADLQCIGQAEVFGGRETWELVRRFVNDMGKVLADMSRLQDRALVNRICRTNLQVLSRSRRDVVLSCACDENDVV
jgi:hypothetical protein